jgi:hypothetical protein
MWIQANDNLFYDNPMVTGPGCFAMFDDYRVGSFYCRRFHSTTPETAEKKLRKIGFKHRRTSEWRIVREICPPKMTIESTLKCHFFPMGKIPIPVNGQGIAQVPYRDFIAWELEWDQEEILNVFEEGKPINIHLARFLLQMFVDVFDIERYRSKLIERLSEWMVGVKRFKYPINLVKKQKRIVIARTTVCRNSEVAAG